MRIPGIDRMLVAAVLVLLVTAPAAAQSPFALKNIGQPLETDDARMAGRGFGMTVTDSLHPGFKNLASLSSLRHVVISFTGYGERTDSDGDGAYRRTYRTFTPDVRLGLPVIKNRLALTAGFKVYRSSEYNTLERKTWTAWEDTLVGNEQFVREGSLFDVPLGVALRLVGSFSVAGSLNLVNGTLTESLANFYLEPSVGINTPLYQPSLRVDQETYDGTSYTVAGLWAPFGGNVRAGASWTTAHDIDVDATVLLEGVSGRAYLDYTMHMPDLYQAGLQLKLLRRWTLGGDAHYQDFGDFSGLVTDERDWAATSGEEYGYSVGLERARAFVRRGGWSNLPIRASAAYRRWGYTLGGAPIDQQTFSIGTGFPFRGNMGQLDLALSWSTLGELDTNGYTSDIWRLTFSIVGLEEWW